MHSLRASTERNSGISTSPARSASLATSLATRHTPRASPRTWPTKRSTAPTVERPYGSDSDSRPTTSSCWEARTTLRAKPSPALLLLLSRIASRRTPFDGLSSATRWRFVRGGLGGKRGLRSPAEAADFYRRSVPWAIQAQGEQAVLDFIDGKQASHLRSVANSPHLARDPRNLAWEAAEKNQDRGAKDMSRLDKLGVQAKSVAATGKLAARSALRAAAWEAPISAVENSIRVFRGGLSKKQAAENTLIDTAGTFVAGGAIAIAVSALRIGFLAHPLVRPIGMGIFAYSTIQRFRRAWQESSPLPESPLTPLVLYFHPDCYSPLRRRGVRSTHRSRRVRALRVGPTEPTTPTLAPSTWRSESRPVASASSSRRFG